MNRVLIFLFCLSFVLVTEDAIAQLNQRKIKKNNKRIRTFKGQKRGFEKVKRYHYVGISINSMHYFGDIAPSASPVSSDIGMTMPGVSMWWGHRFGPRYTLRAAFTWGILRGDDYVSADPNDADARFRYVRNLHFRNHIKELSITTMFDLKENNATYINRVQFTPYAFIGLAVLHHNPKAKVAENSTLPAAGEWVELQPLGTEGQYSELQPEDVNYGLDPYKRIQITVPFGIGVRYRVTEVMDVSSEVGLRYLFTDYIDDVSGNYVDLDVLNSDLARAMSYRSEEQVAAVSGDSRDLDNSNIASIVSNKINYDGRNGNNYTVIAGYGHEHFDSQRGNSRGNDVYMIFSLKFTYIMGGSLHRPKFR